MHCTLDYKNYKVVVLYIIYGTSNEMLQLVHANV